MSKFEELLKIDVSDKIEKRSDSGTELSYLSWCYAWSEFKKVYPDAKYEIKKFKTFADDEKGLRLVPYMYDPDTGYMVNTTITAEDMTYEMWLPVMNSANKAMKNTPYTYTTKKGVEKSVEAATMFDVNKAIMRCLVKNMAMFGLGLYIYAGEDLPDKITTNPETTEEKEKSLTKQVIECKSEAELKDFYDRYKSQIHKNRDLMDIVTQKGIELKKKVA